MKDIIEEIKRDAARLQALADAKAKRSFDEAPGSERVPQYDVELRLASEAVREWKEIAARLYSVRGCHKNEHRRIMAEAAYLRLAQNSQRSEPPAKTI